MTMTEQPTTVRRGAILAVLHSAPLWIWGKRRSDGARIVSIPGGNGHVWQVTEDSCDCPDSLNRHRSCKHQYGLRERLNEMSLAAGLVREREIMARGSNLEVAEMLATKSERRYEDLFPAEVD